MIRDEEHEAITPHEYAVGLVESKRGEYIIAKALFLAHKLLDTETDIRKQQPSDMYDMMAILSQGYPNFYDTFLECDKRGIQV